MVVKLKSDMLDKLKEHQESVFPNADKITLDDVESFALCDFGLCIDDEQTKAKGATPTYMTPLAFHADFEVSKDRFGLGVMALDFLWDADYLNIYQALSQKHVDKVREFRENIIRDNNILKIIYELLNEENNLTVDISQVWERFPGDNETAWKNTLDKIETRRKDLVELVKAETGKNEEELRLSTILFVLSLSNILLGSSTANSKQLSQKVLDRRRAFHEFDVKKVVTKKDLKPQSRTIYGNNLETRVGQMQPLHLCGPHL